MSGPVARVELASVPDQHANQVRPDAPIAQLVRFWQCRALDRAYNAATIATVRPLSPLPGRSLAVGMRVSF